MRIVDKVECYGEVSENSNFQVVCDDEDFDNVWCEGNPEGKFAIFTTWEQVVSTLKKHFPEIIEITAV